MRKAGGSLPYVGSMRPSWFLPFLSVACLAGSVLASEPVLDRPVPTRAVGTAFKKALESQFSANWENVEVRTILRGLAETHKTAVLLDRGVDPTRKMVLQLGYQKLIAGFSRVATEASAEIRILGNTVYVGPAGRASKLRTLEHLRTFEISSNKDRLEKTRVRAVTRERTIHWNDLDEPRQILKELADDAGITIVNLDVVPHDLWAGATLPRASFAEAASLILIQFDMTFLWNADATQIQLVRVPEKVAVEKAYAPQGGPSPRASKVVRERFLKDAAKTWEQQNPGMSAKVDLQGNRVLLSGTLEQHESLTGVNSITAKANTPAGKSPPLERRAFTLPKQRYRVIDLMKVLEKSDVTFKYDPAAFAARKIDLETVIEVEVTKADADEFLGAIFDPIGVRFSYQGHTVTLSPK